MSHNNDRDWLDVYRAAAMEFDRDKLPASIDVAEKAIHQRLRRLPLVDNVVGGSVNINYDYCALPKPDKNKPP